jgi:hypothetical protein
MKRWNWNKFFLNMLLALDMPALVSDNGETNKNSIQFERKDIITKFNIQLERYEFSLSSNWQCIYREKNQLAIVGRPTFSTHHNASERAGGPSCRRRLSMPRPHSSMDCRKWRWRNFLVGTSKPSLPWTQIRCRSFVKALRALRPYIQRWNAIQRRPVFSHKIF